MVVSCCFSSYFHSEQSCAIYGFLFIRMFCYVEDPLFPPGRMRFFLWPAFPSSLG